MRLAGVLALAAAVMAQTPSVATDADLAAASQGRTIRVGTLATGRAAAVPIEVYVARVLAGEGEPRAAEAAQEALAVAIRTFALANRGLHAREGFDLCDSTHCQVTRAATPASRRAALATAGRVLLYDGQPARAVYSASCGGQSETASIVWPGTDYPYLQTVVDDVHADDQPWTLELSLSDIHRALGRAGFAGDRLTGVAVEARSPSGRVSHLRVTGLRPETIAGDEFRMAVGPVQLRSTAFEVERLDDSLRFTGRGFGHGVGMCVIGAGRRATRGDTVDAILAHYYPGVTVTGTGNAWPAAFTAAAARRTTTPRILVRVPPGSAVSAGTVERAATSAYDQLSRRLGASVVPIELALHGSVESFQRAGGRPFASGVVRGTTIDLAPAEVLAQSGGLEAAVRTAVAEVLVAGSFTGRPAWMRIGAARYFGQPSDAAGADDVPPAAADASGPACPSDAELLQAVSADAQRDADQRAEACFARALAVSGDWRSVR